MDIGVVIRPREDAGLMGEIREGIAALRGAGHGVHPRLTFEAGDGERYAAELARSGAELVIAVGGDGTLNEVVNGVLESDWSGRLAVVPTGTANDFALGLGVPEEVEAAFRVALDGESRTVDVGKLNDRYFVNVSTAGFGATATEETSVETKRLLGPWAYVVTGVRKFAELRPSRARFSTPEGEVYDGEVMMFAVGNAKRTGGGSLLTPRAELDDGKLDVLIVPGMQGMDFVSLLPDLRAGTHLDSPDVHYFQTARLDVETWDDLAVNVDGEPVQVDRFCYGLREAALRMMAPESTPE